MSLYIVELGASPVELATVLASFVVLVFGEIAPPSHGLADARPITIIEHLLYPLVAVFGVISRRVNRFVGGDGAIQAPYLEE